MQNEWTNINGASRIEINIVGKRIYLSCIGKSNLIICKNWLPFPCLQVISIKNYLVFTFLQMKKEKIEHTNHFELCINVHNYFYRSVVLQRSNCCGCGNLKLLSEMV